MEKTKALVVLQSLAVQFLKNDEELLPKNFPFEKEELALATAIVTNLIQIDYYFSNLPANYGCEWTKDEENKLLEAFLRGKKLKNIAKDHQRTIGAIEAKIKKILNKNQLAEGAKEERMSHRRVGRARKLHADERGREKGASER